MAFLTIVTNLVGSGQQSKNKDIGWPKSCGSLVTSKSHSQICEAAMLAATREGAIVPLFVQHLSSHMKGSIKLPREGNRIAERYGRLLKEAFCPNSSLR
mmetsp:Transcript_14877/g.23686  ORF Transcript_14877/g.23686 Transcript_14877/m.23686 type:complete len:99 (+) Transcript_14877:1316-1612(+)